jgi:hypothetical protein
MAGANYVLTAGLILLRKIPEPMAVETQARYFAPSRSAFARFAVRPFRLLPADQNAILRSGAERVSLNWSFGLWWSDHMPIKPLAVTDRDLMRARQIERSWTPPLKGLSGDEAEIIARAIAQGIAEGRKQGLELAKDMADCPTQAH